MYEKNILIYWSDGQPITAPREHGGTMPFPRAPQLWQGGELPPLWLSAHQSFFWVVSGDWTANPLVVGQAHSPLSHGCPEYKYTNAWKKHTYKYAYKYMKKTCIQMNDKNTHTKSHTNVWQKPACKFMKKTQTRIKMYEKNAYKHAYKCMKKNRHTNVWKKQAYKCMRKTCIQTRIQMYEKTHTFVW